MFDRALHGRDDRTVCGRLTARRSRRPESRSRSVSAPSRAGTTVEIVEEHLFYDLVSFLRRIGLGGEDHHHAPIRPASSDRRRPPANGHAGAHPRVGANRHAW